MTICEIHLISYRQNEIFQNLSDRTILAGIKTNDYLILKKKWYIFNWLKKENDEFYRSEINYVSFQCETGMILRYTRFPG